MFEVAAQVQMKSNLRDYNQAIIDQVEQSLEAYHLNVQGDIMSLGMDLSQAVLEDMAKIAKRMNAFP